MTGRHRFVVLALVLVAVLAAVILVAFAGNACPGSTSETSCPDAGRNRIVVVALASISVAAFLAPLAFLAEFILRRRIIYRGAWVRAGRRGLLAAIIVAALAALRLGGALTVAVAIFVVLLAAIIEWFAVRRAAPP